MISTCSNPNNSFGIYLLCLFHQDNMNKVMTFRFFHLHKHMLWSRKNLEYLMNECYICWEWPDCTGHEALRLNWAFGTTDLKKNQSLASIGTSISIISMNFGHARLLRQGRYADHFENKIGFLFSDWTAQNKNGKKFVLMTLSGLKMQGKGYFIQNCLLHLKLSIIVVSVHSFIAFKTST